MSIIRKIVTAIRGGARELGEAVVDSNSMRILEQEIADQENAIEKAKDSLTDVMADRAKTARTITSLEQKITEHEGFATQALEKSDEGLALEIAQKIAEFEQEKSELENILTNYDSGIESLKTQIKDAEKSIQEYKRELSLAKTTENVQKARASVNKNLSSNLSQASAARDTLKRIKERQQHTEDKIKATEQLNAETGDQALQKKLSDAGIDAQSNRANDILARLKAKSQE